MILESDSKFVCASYNHQTIILIAWSIIHFCANSTKDFILNSHLSDNHYADIYIPCYMVHHILMYYIYEAFIQW